MAVNPYTTNLELQLDARDITGLSDGASVTTWTDSSAAGNDVTQATSSRRPVYKTNIIGSNPAVRFDSVAESLHGSWANSWSGASGCTLFWVTQYHNYPGWDFPYLYSMGNSNNYSAVIGGQSSSYISSRNQFVGYFNNFIDSNAALYTLSPSIPIVGGVTFKNGTSGMKIINALATSPERNIKLMNYTSEDFVIGNGYNGSPRTDRGYVGDISMFLVYKEYMSDSNIDDVMNWLLTEFDLHTQAGGGGVIRVPGMNGGMNT